MSLGIALFDTRTDTRSAHERLQLFRLLCAHDDENTCRSKDIYAYRHNITLRHTPSFSRLHTFADTTLNTRIQPHSTHCRAQIYKYMIWSLYHVGHDYIHTHVTPTMSDMYTYIHTPRLPRLLSAIKLSHHNKHTLLHPYTHLHMILAATRACIHANASELSSCKVQLPRLASDLHFPQF